MEMNCAQMYMYLKEEKNKTNNMCKKKKKGKRGTYVDFHLLVKAVAAEKTVRHSQPVRLHRVVWPVVVRAHESCDVRQTYTRTSELTSENTHSKRFEKVGLS